MAEPTDMKLYNETKDKVDKIYDKPSAYKSGAIVRCRKGEIWKDLKEDLLNEYSDNRWIRSSRI